MPRLPVDGKKVVEHRITFGTKERELIDQFSLSYRINSVAPSFAEIVKDATALYAIGIAIEIIFDVELPFIVTTDDAQELWDGLKGWFSSGLAKQAAIKKGLSTQLFSTIAALFQTGVRTIPDFPDLDFGEGSGVV